MAESKSTKLNPSTATVREAAEAYATRNGLNPAEYVNAAVRYLGDYADEPGSAVGMFMPDDDGETKLSRTFKVMSEGDEKINKFSMQVLRYVGATVAQDLPPNSNVLAFLPDEGPDTARNVKIFGVKEPPKATSSISVKTDKATMGELFRQLTEIAKDPKQEAAATAVIFNLQNGLRPNAAGQLKLGSYYPETRSIYISAETKGAKGRRVNVPLNDIADTILQNRIAEGKVVNGSFFVKPNGNTVSSQDMTNILKQIRIEGLVFDPEGNDGKGRYYDSLAPDPDEYGGDVPGKRGSPLLRNIHTKIGQRSGISFERIAYLQGRSFKAAAEGSTGEVVGYAQDYPGDLDVAGPDARNANVVSSYFADAASKSGFEISSTIVPPEQRVGRSTPGYESYFDAPIVGDDATPPKAASDISDNAEKTVRGFGLDDFFGLKSLVPPVVATGAAYALSGVKKAGAAILPVVGFEGTRQEMLERGVSPEEAVAQATAEELSSVAGITGPISRGLADATIEGAKKGLEEQYGYKGPVTLETIDKIGTELISGGRFKFPNFASGGFIEKKGD